MSGTVFPYVCTTCVIVTPSTVGFNGPCGGNNTYEMTLYALDVATLTELTSSSTGAAARTAIEAHDTASTKLTILSRP